MEKFIEYGSDCLLNLRLNANLANEKQLSYNNYELYFKIQSLYKKIFEYRIDQLIGLTEANETLKNSGLDFGNLSENKKSAYHKLSYLNLDYIYIQNFLFIEKLKIEYIEIFKEKIINNNYEIDNKLIEIIDETYKEVMTVSSIDGKDDNQRGIICYGIESPINHFYNNSLALRIEYGRNTISFNDRDFLVNYNKKKELLEKVIKSLEEKGSSNGITVEVRVMKKL